MIKHWKRFEFLAVLAVLFGCGIGFAIWNVHFRGLANSWSEHLWQWLPLLVAAVCYLWSGYKLSWWTWFSFFGQVGCLLVVPGVGYVAGRMLAMAW